MTPVQFQMSQKDGKAMLNKSVNAKGFYTLKSPDHTIAESCEMKAKASPVKIITVKETLKNNVLDKR